jgi:hypothetical protein
MVKAKSNKILSGILFLLICISSGSLAQDGDKGDTNKVWGDWQISFSMGIQMSGIKDEDFIASNFAPMLHVSFGKWFSPVLALEIGYRGWYFNTISDDDRHNYGYYNWGAVLNIKALSHNYKETSIWLLYFHAGSGYFYNYYYERPNICADFGISNNFRITKNLLASLDIAAILGWDIYQGDEDILPGITVGVHYVF